MPEKPDTIITVHDGEVVWKISLRAGHDTSSFPILVEEYHEHGRVFKEERYLSIDGALKFVDALMIKITEARR